MSLTIELNLKNTWAKEKEWLGMVEEDSELFKIVWKNK
jgi:hypothetical protein